MAKDIAAQNVTTPMEQIDALVQKGYCAEHIADALGGTVVKGRLYQVGIQLDEQLFEAPGFQPDL